MTDNCRTDPREDGDNVAKRSTKKNRMNWNGSAVKWMKTHTIEDMKALVCELSEEGKDVSEMVEVVNELESIVHHDPNPELVPGAFAHIEPLNHRQRATT